VSEPRGAVRVLKLAAAQRELDAAIRMTFAEEDVLAITTVANAAYRVLRDIREKRGHKVLADQWRDAVLGVAHALARGELPEDDINLFKKSDLWPVISKLAEQIRARGTDRKISELRSLVEVHVPAHTEKLYWAAFNKSANFLKHADIDYDASLAADEVDPDILILAGCSLYLDLIGRLTPEMQVWSAHELCVKRGLTPPKDGPFENIAEALRTVDPTQRNGESTKLILNLKQHGQRARDPPA
jgi:hypothetical protein